MIKSAHSNDSKQIPRIPFHPKAIYEFKFMDFEMGGGQDGSKTMIACETCAYLLEGSMGMPSLENSEFNILSDCFRRNLGQKFPNNILITHTRVQ